jgi:hypothetical protein
MGFQVEQVEFYPTGVNLDPDEAKAFIQFECDWLERAYGMAEQAGLAGRLGPL